MAETKKERKIKNIIVKGKLSKGGMGEIYKGFHTDLEKEVVLKRVIFKGEDAEIRFKNEAKVLIDLHHENIVPVFDYFSSRGVYYILMDYIDGKNLRQIIEEYETLPDLIILLILQQILRGFVYFHKKGVVHRDIKPENIIISKNGVVKIVDFGIAFSNKIENNIDEKEMIIGTPKYIAPEVFKGEEATDKVDIYALGLILYELVSSVNPFNNLNEHQLIKQKKNGKILPLKYFKDDVSYFFNILAKKMVHKNPKRRPSSEKLLKTIEKKIKNLKIKDNEKIIEEFFNETESVKNKTQQTIKIKKKNNELVTKSLSSTSKLLNNLRNNLNKFLIFFAILLFFAAGFLFYNFIENGTFKSVFHPYKYSPIKISISTYREDKYFRNNLLIYLNGIKIKNNERYVTKSGLNKLEIYYRGIYLFRELNLLSFKELSDIRKSFIPSKKYLRLFKKIIVNMDSLQYYRILGQDYRESNLISKDYKYNQFIISDISRFFSTKSFVKYTPYDAYTNKKIDFYKIYFDENGIFTPLKNNDEKIYSFNLSFKVISNGYYTKKINNLILSSSNYIYPVLFKKSGILQFYSNIKGIKIKLNGEKIGWIGQETKKLEKYGEINDRFKKIYLNPGKYYLELIYKGRIYTNGPFNIVSNRVVQINIKGDENKIIEIKRVR